MDFYRVSTRYAVGGIQVNHQGVVVDTAPIFKRFWGRLWINVEQKLKEEQATIEKLPSPGPREE
jgi:hypothetical protein